MTLPLTTPDLMTDQDLLDARKDIIKKMKDYRSGDAVPYVDYLEFFKLIEQEYDERGLRKNV